MRRFFNSSKTATKNYPNIPMGKGIQSLGDYDKLVSSNTYPLNHLSTEGKNTFRNGIRFMNTTSGNIVTGIGMDAIAEMGLEKYLDLVKLVTGRTPVIASRPGHGEPYPFGAWIPGYEPRPTENHRCYKSDSLMCWVPSNIKNSANFRF